MIFFRSKKQLAGILIVLLLLISIQVYPLLTQEENTLLILSGIVQLNLNDVDIYEYDSDSATKYYIAKSKDGHDPIFKVLEDDGWTYREQFGSGFLFKKSSNETEQVTVGSIQFSRYFTLWKVPLASQDLP
jgi:hypothetical protein